MSTPISLIQVSKTIPTDQFMKYLDFPSILVLRKVCHDLRNFIDDTKPASRFTKITITVYSESIHFSSSSFSARIEYKKNGEGCLVKKYHKYEEIKTTMLENEDFVTVFCKDFDIILRHQKTVLEDFSIDLTYLNSKVKERILESVNKSLKSMSHLFKVKSLDMRVSDQNEILAILPYMDPKLLKKIIIGEHRRKFNVVLNLDEIGQLEQWKQADELYFLKFQIPYQVEILKDFSSIHILYQGVSIEELISLKEIFLHSSTLTRISFAFNVDNSVNRQKFIEVFGQPFVDINQNWNWFFRIPDTNRFLKIFHKYRYIVFSRIEESDVPQIAVIRN